jgi:hypothetical protein
MVPAYLLYYSASAFFDNLLKCATTNAAVEGKHVNIFTVIFILYKCVQCKIPKQLVIQ